jgi:uncharacterized protein YbdZ (MbtH family)
MRDGIPKGWNIGTVFNPHVDVNDKTLPKGMIRGWRSDLPMPEGWALCDGNDETPDFPDFNRSGCFIMKIADSINIIPKGFLMACGENQDVPKGWRRLTLEEVKKMTTTWIEKSGLAWPATWYIEKL